MDTLSNIFHVKLLVFVHLFISIRISQLKYRLISGNQARYDTSVIAKYLDTITVKTSTKFYKTALPSDIIFTKADASTNDELVEKLTREFNIHYRTCIGSLIYLLSTEVDMIFQYTS